MTGHHNSSPNHNSSQITLSSLVAATNKSITNSKVGSSMISKHPTPLILSDRFKRTLINVNHQYPREFLRQFPASIAAAIIEEDDGESGGSDDDDTDFEEDRHDKKAKNNNSNISASITTTTTTVAVSTAAPEKLKTSLSHQKKGMAMKQQQHPLPAISSNKNSGMTSTSLAMPLIRPTMAGSFKTNSENGNLLHFDGNGNNNNNNASDLHHEDGNDNSGSSNNKNDVDSEVKKDEDDDEDSIKYTPFPLQPKSSYNPSSLSKRDLSRMNKQIAAKYGAYKLPDVEIVKKIEETNWRARRVLKREAQEAKQVYLEDQELLSKRRGHLGNDERHLKSVELAQKRMKMKIDRIMKMKEAEIQSLIEGQINSIDAIKLKEFLPSAAASHQVKMLKSYTIQDRHRVQGILDS